MNALFFLPLILLALFVLLAVALLMQGRWLRKQSGLPPGEVVYEDVSGLMRKPLYSQRLGLAGKPDYLLKDRQNNLIPVEVKSGAAPHNGQPHESHRLQLAAYFFLIEDVLQRPAPYGLICYRNRTIEIANTDELRKQLMNVIAQMRTLLARGSAHRNHTQAQRCASCSIVRVCNEKLS